VRDACAPLPADGGAPGAKAPDALQNDARPLLSSRSPQRSTLAAAGEAEDVLFASGQPEQCAPRRRAPRGLRAAARLG
jgi:hypothetical protein